ncbi:putative pentatricopeptide repeat-containing protein At3g05240 [Magnolia sinica]|uniref:putative pentatricopeptide repeat-containing protein At3g05240 n=1 Tax=Magnolia sinica TaxID=86752 RepID=UPI0026590E6B|nr:putative pentatricopeptide repeat-containing protein At3g05240 [Magnolia sinica]
MSRVAIALSYAPRKRPKPPKPPPKPITHEKILHLLKSCASPTHVSQLHALLIRRHLPLRPLVLFCASSNMLITYASLLFPHLPRRADPFLCNSMARGLSDVAPEQAVLLYNDMVRAGPVPDKFTFPIVFKALGPLAAKEKAREAHGTAVKLKVVSDFYVQRGLIDFYAENGEIDDAWKVFDEMSGRGSVGNGGIQAAGKAFPVMSLRNGEIGSAGKVSNAMLHWDSVGNGEKGVDGEALGGVSELSFVENAEIGVGREASEEMPQRNLVVGCSEEEEEVLWLKRAVHAESERRRMKHVIAPLEKCSGMRELKGIHGFMVRNGLNENPILVSRVLIFCANSELGSLDYARAIFEKMDEPSLFLYTTMIRGYADKGFPTEVCDFYNRIFREGLIPDNYLFPPVLKSCGSLNSVSKGEEIHGTVVKLGFESDPFTNNCLITMYADCGAVGPARQVFDGLADPDLVSWNSLISGLNLNCRWDEAISVFREMEVAGVKPNRLTIVSVLTACMGSGNLDAGRLIHEKLDDGMVKCDVVVGTALVDMYARCGQIDFARELFNGMFTRNVLTWNAMVAGYSRLERLEDAVSLFLEMEYVDIKPNQTTLAILLSICTRMKDFGLGKWILHLVEKNKLELTLELGNALIEFSTRLISISVAEGVFERMPERDLFTLNTMIAGYANSKYAREALNLFREMQDLGAEPSKETLAHVLSACGNVGALGIGREINEYINTHEIELDVLLGTALLDMYAKCGCIEEAREVFVMMPEKNLLSWTAMIIGFALNGHSNNAIGLFLEMQRSGIEPDEITFIGILMACNFSGSVDEGYKYLEYMERKCNVKPNLEHYRHMVELLGRRGLLGKALYIVSKMQPQPNGAVWGALLGACRLHGNLRLGMQLGRLLSPIHLKHDNVGFFVQLCDIYATLGDWVAVEKVRALLKATRLTTKLGLSAIELHGVVHEFSENSTSHPQWEEICSMLSSLREQLSMLGYKPNISQVLLGVNDER